MLKTHGISSRERRTNHESRSTWRQRAWAGGNGKSVYAGVAKQPLFECNRITFPCICLPVLLKGKPLPKGMVLLALLHTPNGFKPV